jgi:spore coat polysaccharide biosynthesis protein SpsF
MRSIMGKPMLWHIVQRIRYSTFINDIVIATTVHSRDDEVALFSKKNNVAVFRGSEEDVLDRYYRCAQCYSFKDIVRITADDAFKDPVVIDKVIRMYMQNNVDYASNTINPTFPLGLDVEVFSFSALTKAWKQARNAFEREHVTPYIWMNPDIFKIINVTYNEKNLSHLRWTVDTKEDLHFARKIYKRLYHEGKVFLMDDILLLLKQHPEFLDINKNVKPKDLF